MHNNFNLSEKLKKKLFFLKEIIKSQEKVSIAFSGGVDSTLLLKISVEVLGRNVLPITIKGAMMPESELLDALNLAKEMGATPLVIQTNIFSLENFINNEPDRCYHCKKYIFEQIKKAAIDSGFPIIMDGSNLDDQLDYRPGLKALSELKIISPFTEAKLTKKEIRTLSAYYRLETAKKPAMACLATRIPTYTKITEKDLSLIESGEEILKALNLMQYRLRLIGNLAKIECSSEDFQTILNHRSQLIKDMKTIGLHSIVLDLNSYQQGKMNCEIDQTK